MVLLDVDAFAEQDLLALPRGLLPECEILRELALFAEGFDKAPDARAEPFGDMAPREAKNDGCRELLRPTTWPLMMARSFSSLASFCVSNPTIGVYGIPVRAKRIAPAVKPQGMSASPLKFTLWRTSFFAYVHSAPRSKGFSAVSRRKRCSFESSSILRASV